MPDELKHEHIPVWTALCGVAFGVSASSFWATDFARRVIVNLWGCGLCFLAVCLFNYMMEEWKEKAKGHRLSWLLNLILTAATVLFSLLVVLALVDMYLETFRGCRVKDLWER